MKPLNIIEGFKLLERDPESDIETVKLIEGACSYILAELKPKRVLAAHYHKSGSEIYHVLSGEGTIELGRMNDCDVQWSQSIDLAGGDVIEVEEGCVHRLSNPGDEVLKLIFIAPESHLGDDRFFV